MAKMKTTTAPTADRGGFGIERPGRYHLIVTNFDPQPNNNGTLIDAWGVEVGVLQGTAQSTSGDCLEHGKKVEILFQNPAMTHKDGGNFCRELQSRLLLVTGIITEDQLNSDIEWDTDHIVGRQFIGNFTSQPYVNKKGATIDAVKLNGKDIWHVDDPQVADVPKDANALKMLPANLRMTSKKPAQSNPQPTQGAYSEKVEPKSAPTSTPAPVDISDV